MNLYLCTEFTGLHKNTTLISIGIISESDKLFYAELKDYDKSQVDEWTQENIINNLSLRNLFGNEGFMSLNDDDNFMMTGNTKDVVEKLTEWLYKFDEVKIWSDNLPYNWVLFNNLFGGTVNIPKNIYHIPFDICTLFEVKGIDPDISREEFINNSVNGVKHNSLYGSKVIKACYEKLINI